MTGAENTDFLSALEDRLKSGLLTKRQAARQKWVYLHPEKNQESKAKYENKNRDTINENKRNRRALDKSYQKEYYLRNKDRITERTNIYKLKTMYGITPEIYEQMRIDQNNCCAICSVDFNEIPRRPDIDHCHRTGKVRALLCWSCNGGLGQYKDDPQLMRKAADYLEFHT